MKNKEEASEMKWEKRGSKKTQDRIMQSLERGFRVLGFYAMPNELRSLEDFEQRSAVV